MACDPPRPESASPIPGATRGAVAPVPDEDDGIHVASVTHVERHGEAFLRVAVVWFEDGRRVGVVVDVPEAPGRPGHGAIGG